MKKAIFVFSFCLAVISSQAQLIADTATLSDMNRMFLKTKELAKNRDNELFGVFKQNLTEDEKQALTFLYAYMPLSDLADYNGQFFLDNVKMSLQARTDFLWCKNIPEEVFLHFVLPVRVNNENLDSFRIVMYDELKERISGLSMKQAALEVNHWCHEKVTYKASDERTSSPLNTIQYSLGRCGEESTFTVAAMRMAGIPARQVYTPRWAHTDDNHAWVEVWVDGTWYFLGACEPEPDLNMGWFANPAARAMLVHTRAYGMYHGIEPVITKGERFSELNLIANYAPVKYFTVRVTDENGKAVENAKVEYQLYNYAEFYPIAKTYTDSSGYTGITCGLGDLLIWANRDDAYGYKKITVENTDTVIVKISTSEPVNIIEEYDLVPPVERSVAVASESGAQENSKRLQYEDSLRTVYMATFRDTAWIKKIAMIDDIDADTACNIFCKSFGNWKEVEIFINNTPSAMRHWVLSLLSVISEKDLRDTKEYILTDHLTNAFKYDSGFSKTEPEIFSKYVLSGRISNEWMKGWRAFLQSEFDASFIQKSRMDITVITDWIKGNILIDDTSNLHSRAPLTPLGVYELKVADSKSRDIFFVAICRSFNIPARLNPETLIPEYWKDSVWNKVQFKISESKNVSTGYFHLINDNPDIEPKYTLNFTIAGFSDGVYRTLLYDENKLLKDFAEKNEVESGKYILVTGNRLNDGSVLSSVFFFNVTEGKTTDVHVNIREKSIEEKPLGTLDTTAVSLNDYTSGKVYRLSELVKNKGAIIVFIDPDKEPSKHVMVDIAAVKESFEKWGGNLLFIIPGKSKSTSFVPSVFKGLPSQSIFMADTKKDDFFQKIENQKGCSLLNKYPVVLFVNSSGQIYYYSEGYSIGTGEQLLKSVNKTK
jgi:hypothetical protein